MQYEIKKLSPALAEDYLDFFDNRAFSDGSPFYPCYCNAFNLSKKRMQAELYDKTAEYGNTLEGWIRALRESAERMVNSGEIQGYLAFDHGVAIGWCNANDRTSYYRTGEFDLHTIPEDENIAPGLSPGKIKSIVCFEIAPEYRGKGIATQLLQKVLADAKADGYQYVEAYPMESVKSFSLAFTGPMYLYEKAGFEIYNRSGVTYTMRKLL